MLLEQREISIRNVRMKRKANFKVFEAIKFAYELNLITSNQQPELRRQQGLQY